jgi:glutamine amidotransferase-like uncharacterized protein
MSRNTPSKRTIVIVAAIVSVVALSSVVLYLNIPGPLNGVNVAIYTDHGVRATSRIALETMFTWMGANVTIIASEDIANGDLDLYDIFVAPGGCWCDERCEILDEKGELVREYVEGGGAYFGVDGGASYVTSYRLALFDGELFVDTFGGGDFLVNITINTDSTGPDLSSEIDTYLINYEASGYFNSSDMTGIIPIATYTGTNQACMIAFECGNGKVFLSSPHPEYEEGTMRDGTEVWDATMNDPDSEWDLMLKICQWLLQ